MTAAIDSVGETETFTIQLDGPQQLTLLVEPNANAAASLAVRATPPRRWEVPSPRRMANEPYCNRSTSPLRELTRSR